MASNSDDGNGLPPKETIEKLTQVFSVFDNEPTLDQLSTAFSAIGQSLSEQQLKAMQAVVEGEKKKPIEERLLPSDTVQSFPVSDNPVLRRRYKDQKDLLSAIEDAKTGWEAFQRGVAKFGDANCLGTRKIIDSDAGEYVWSTYKQVDEQVKAFASGLIGKVGLAPGDFVGVNMKTRHEWTTSNLACQSQHMPIVTLYDSFGNEALGFIINKTKLSVVITALPQLTNLSTMLDDIPSVKHFICTDPVPDEIAQKFGDRSLYGFDDLVAYGKENPVESAPPSPEDLSLVCFTSGTTGMPKGVMHTHQSLVASMAAGFQVLHVSSDDVHISFLPLAHIMEYWLQAMFLYRGVSIGYFQGDVRKLMDDIKCLQPTVFVAVPRLLNRIYSSIQAAAGAKTGVPKLLTQLAIASKTKALQTQGLVKSYWDWIVFAPIRQVLGGRVRLIATGSAPMSPDALNFFRLAFSAEVLEGYGMSEAMVTNISSPITRDTGTVGPPFASVEIKLISVPEMEYSIDDKPYPRGEILIRGPSVMKGYFEEPDLTAEALDDDGFYHTGDIGLWISGALKIIDRRKNLFKTSQGEYIAPIKIENIYSRSPFVAQSFVYGHSLKNCLVAIVVPDPEYLEKWAKLNNIDQDIETLLHNDKLKQAVLDSIVSIAKKAGLMGFEIVKAIHLHGEPFSVENNLMTPTFKVKRFVARKTFAQQIDQMYDSIDN